MSVRKDTIQLSVEINGTKAGKTYKELRANARDLTRELDHMVEGTDEFVAKAAELKRVNDRLAQIRASTRGVANEARQSGTSITSLTDIFKKGTVAALAFFSVQKVTAWGKELVNWATKGAASLEAMRRKSQQVFGEAIDLVEDYAAINAQSLGVTEEKFASLAARIGSILIPMGISREEIAKMSSDLTSVAAAMAEWSEGTYDAERATQILGKALVGQRGSLDELGIIIQEVDVQQRLMAKGQKDLTGTQLQAAKAIANYELLLERSQAAQRNFAQGADTIARSGNRIKAAWEQVKESLLAGVLPVMRRLGNAFADMVAPVKRQSDQVAALQAQFNLQIETLQRANISQENRRKLIDQINTKYREYLPNLITEKTTLTELRDIQDQVNQKFQQRILLIATEESLQDVSKRLIAAKTEELRIAQELVKAELELERFDVSRVGQGRDGSDQAFVRAATAAQGLTDKLNANQQEQKRLQEEFEKTSEAAQELGLDISAILAGPFKPNGDEPEDDPTAWLQRQLKSIEDRFRLEELEQLKLIENLRDNEELYNAERERISLETSQKIASAQAKLYKETSLDNLKLLQDANDAAAKLQEHFAKMSLDDRIKAIEQERDARVSSLSTLYDEELLTLEEFERRRELVVKESELRIAQTRLSTLQANSNEWIQLNRDIQRRQEELDKLREQNSLSTQINIIEKSQAAAIKALEELKLEEEDLQKAREIINLEADIQILEARLKLYREGSKEFIEIENEIADKRRALNGVTFQAQVPDDGQYSTTDDRERHLERIREIEQEAYNIASHFAQATLAEKRAAIEEELRLRLDAIDTTERRALEAAEGDVVLQKRIRLQAEKERNDAEKQAAIQRKKIARQEAVIQGALAIIRVIPNPVAMAAAAVLTGIQLATIDKTGFYKGGPTGKKGIYKDHQGHDVAGVVHTGEYVVPSNVLEDPATRPVVEYLEAVRRRKGGFAEGGYTSPSTRPDIPAGVVHHQEQGLESETFRNIQESLKNIESILATMPRDLKAHVVLSEFEAKQEELDYIRQASVV